MSTFSFGQKKLQSTEFSDFFRHSSSGEKKRIYEKVIRSSIKQQQQIKKLASASN